MAGWKDQAFTSCLDLAAEACNNSLSPTSNTTVPKMGDLLLSSQSQLPVRKCSEAWLLHQTYLTPLSGSTRCTDAAEGLLYILGASLSSSSLCGCVALMLFSCTNSWGATCKSCVCERRHSALLKVLAVWACNHDFLFFPYGLSAHPGCQMSEADRHSAKQLKPFSAKAVFS